MARMRTKMNNLISHTTLDGKSYCSEQTKLRAKFNKGIITSEELRKLASFTLIQRRTIQYTEVKIFGKWQSINKLGLSLNLLISENFELR